MNDSKSNVVLEARDVRKTYRLGAVDVPVLKGASLEVREGEWVAILGASGSGKSTLLHLLGDLDEPDASGEGEIFYQRRPLSRFNANERNRYRNQAVGFVFQFYHLLPELNVVENAMLPGSVKTSLRSRRFWVFLMLGFVVAGAALGAALAQNGEKVVVVDFDVGLRNLDLVMGAERRVVYDLVNVIQGEAKLAQALIRDKRSETLYLLPASQTRDKDNLTPEGVEKVITALKSAFDWVICDSPAGIERGATLAMRHADIAIVVTNPEVSSVRDSDRIIGLLDSKTERAEKGEKMEKHLLLTRYDPSRAERGDMLKVDDVLEILSIPLLGIIPESMDVLRASNLGSPVTLADGASAPARAYFDAARRLKGEALPVTVPGEKRGFFGKIFGRKAA